MGADDRLAGDGPDGTNSKEGGVFATESDAQEALHTCVHTHTHIYTQRRVKCSRNSSHFPYKAMVGAERRLAGVILKMMLGIVMKEKT